MRATRIVGASVAVIALFLMGVHYVCDYLAIDSCVDLGGAWDYTASQCKHDSIPRTAMPYVARYPWLVAGTIVATVFGIVLGLRTHSPSDVA